MDLHEQRQLEVARQMAKVKARARPWHAIFALVLAAAAGIISSTGAMGGPLDGTVTEIGITYLRLDTADGPMSLPNAQVFAAAVSHPAQSSGSTTHPPAYGQQAAPATPGDAPAPGAASPPRLKSARGGR